jgi:hypothetical protein
VKIVVHLGVGISGGDRRDVLEMDDTATEQEIEAEVKDWAWNFLDLSWVRKEE